MTALAYSVNYQNLMTKIWKCQYKNNTFKKMRDYQMREFIKRRKAVLMIKLIVLD